MEDQPPETPSDAVPPRKVVAAGSLRPLGPILVKRAREVTTTTTSTEHGAEPRRHQPAPHAFVPYPVELAEMERRRLLSPVKLRLLGLRRFAHPVSGMWITTTNEVARFIYADRTTTQKALRSLEFAHYVYFHYRRDDTVQLIILFGGFPKPPYLEDGKRPLRWDADATVENGTSPHRPAHVATGRHSMAGGKRGFPKPQNALSTTGGGTVPNSSLFVEKYIYNERSLLDGGKLTEVDNFVPTSHDEAVVHGLAKALGEEFMNSFLALRRRYGLAHLQRACGLAQDKALDTQFPLRQSPGAYVRWLLQSGKCGPS